MYTFAPIEQALEDLRQGKIILATDDPDREMKAISSVPPSLPPRKTLTLWQPMAKA